MDLAFSPDGNSCIAGVVVWDVAAKAIVEQRVVVQPVAFPYVPGLLSFREAPALLAALRRVRCQPDVLMCDGHGLAHPRRFGLACHVGVVTGMPTIGCAKSRLIGEEKPVGDRQGDGVPLVDRGEVVGTILRTRDAVKPVFVSVGHLATLGAAERIVLTCVIRYRLPEPTRLADALVAAVKRERSW